MRSFLQAPEVNIQSMACRILGHVADKKDAETVALLQAKATSLSSAAGVRAAASDALCAIDMCHDVDDGFS